MWGERDKGGKGRGGRREEEVQTKAGMELGGIGGDNSVKGHGKQSRRSPEKVAGRGQSSRAAGQEGRAGA